MDETTYKSQFGQDRFVEQYIRAAPGTFVEAGAWDGVSLSNTYHLEMALGWRGLLVEPLRRFFPAMHARRPGAHCFNGVLSASEEDEVPNALYLEAGDRSGVLKWMDPRAIRDIERFFTAHPGDVGLHWLPNAGISKLLAWAQLDHVDYFSLDIEGGELDIVKSLRLGKEGGAAADGTVAVDLFGIEDNHDGGMAHDAYLRGLGYVRLGHLGPDYFFLHERKLEALRAERGPSHIEEMFQKLA